MGLEYEFRDGKWRIAEYRPPPDNSVKPVKPNYFKDAVRPVKPDFLKEEIRPIQADWKKHEKDIASRAGASQVAGSGNQPGKPGDVRGTKFLRDGKATVRKNISISAKTLRKIVAEALALGRTPVIEVRLESAEFPCPTDWVVLPAVDFQDLVERYGS